MDNKLWAESTMRRIIEKLDKTADEIGASFPHTTRGDAYNNEDVSWWTNGFWPGILWTAYLVSSNEKYARIANEIERKIDAVLNEYDLLDHDVGFLWLLSSGANYKITGNKESRNRLLKAASFLASRFNLKGNFIRAWNHTKGYAIIDCMMNLPLLYFASEEIDDSRFNFIAEAHVNTVMKYFVRPDSSVNHIVSFNPESGEFIESVAGQGARADSAWSRGASWALYGLALAYRHLGDEKMLQKSKAVADFFMESSPEDFVAHWDFRVERNENTPRDTSAAACAACGMLELAEHLPENEAVVYKEYAAKILKSLTDNYSNLDNDKDQALLHSGTGNAPKNKNINVGLIYGDYFYIEGISRLIGNKKIFWYSK